MCGRSLVEFRIVRALLSISIHSNGQAENDPDGFGVLVCSFRGEGVHRVLVNKVSFVRVGKGVGG